MRLVPLSFESSGLSRIVLCLLLLCTGAVKLISAAGHQRILQVPEALSGVQIRAVLVFAGLLELALVAACLTVRSSRILGLLVLWFSSCAMIYRAGLLILDPASPCPCMGTLSGWTGISDRIMSRIAFACLILITACALRLLLQDFAIANVVAFGGRETSQASSSSGS